MDSESDVESVETNLDYLPGDVRRGLLLELSKKEESARIFKEIIRDHFHELPENIRNLVKSVQKFFIRQV